MKIRRYNDGAFEDFECEALCVMADDGREYFSLRMNNVGRLTVKAPIFCNHAGADRAMTLTIRPIVANEIHIERNTINEP